MHSAIFVAVIPDDQGKWTIFLTNVQRKLVRFPDICELAENVWLVDATKSVGALGHLVALADDQAITAATLPLADAPRWLPADFDPKPMGGRSGGMQPRRP